MAFARAQEGTAAEPDAQCLMETVMLATLIADLEGSDLNSADLSTSEDCLRRRLRSIGPSKWHLSESEAQSLRAVINEHDRQLRESRLQILVKATERFERLLEKVQTLEEVFDARRT